MEARTEQDAFASITKLCRPTASQEAKLPNCPFAREAEIFADTNSDELSSSPELTPLEPAGIVMVSPPGSGSSTQQRAEDDAIFHTPPEHHLPSYFSAEDQILDESSADGAWPLDRLDKSKTRVPAEVICGETVPADETEAVTDETEAVTAEIEANGGAQDETEVIVLDTTDSGRAGNSDDDSVDTVRAGEIDVVPKTGELLKGGVPKVSDGHGNQRSGDSFEAMEDIMVSKNKKPGENNQLGGSFGNPNGKENIGELKHNTGNSLEKAEKIHSDCNLKTRGKRIEEVDEFRYVSQHDSQGSPKRKRRRHLPLTLEGEGKRVGGQSSVETMESKSGLLDFLDALRVIVGNKDGGCEDVDFLEAARRRGLTFPRPRWWPVEGDDE